MPKTPLNRKYVGRRYLATEIAEAVDSSNPNGLAIRCVCYDFNLGRPYTYAEIENGKVKDPEMSITSVTMNDVVTTPPSSLSGDALTVWKETTVAELKMKAGQIYTVRQYTTQDGKRHYYYAYYSKESVDKVMADRRGSLQEFELINYYGNLLNGGSLANTSAASTLVLNNADGLYYKMDGGKVDFTANKNENRPILRRSGGLSAGVGLCT